MSAETEDERALRLEIARAWSELRRAQDTCTELGRTLASVQLALGRADEARLRVLNARSLNEKAP